MLVCICRLTIKTELITLGNVDKHKEILTKGNLGFT